MKRRSLLLLFIISMPLLSLGQQGGNGQQQAGQATGNDQLHGGPAVAPAKVRPMDKKSFGAAMKSIKSISFCEAKMEKAKSIFTVNYITTEQAITVANDFHFDDDKTTFAKFIYSRVTDQANFPKFAKVFYSDGSKQELMDFIKANQQPK